MSKQVLQTWNIERNMEEMLAVLAEVMAQANTLGHHPSTVYSNKLRVALVEETLTDGSAVLNVCFHDGGSALKVPAGWRSVEA